MSFLDQLAGNLNKVKKDLSSKAQELTDTAKLNSRINDANSLIKSTYAAIGEALFEKYGADAENEFAEQFKIIAEAKAAIVEYKNEIMKIKGVSVCPNCGAEVNKTSAFCPSCGTKIERPVEEPETTEEKKVCSKCGAELEDDAVFCTSCGAAVEAKEAETEE